ncbi:MAG TPA: hypothetical protein VH951_03930, partial [Dehalococcoidia bacterium]
MLIIGAIFVFIAIVLVVMALSPKTSNVLEARMATLRGELPAFNFGQVAKGESLTTRVLGPMGQALGRKVAGWL